MNYLCSNLTFDHLYLNHHINYSIYNNHRDFIIITLSHYIQLNFKNYHSIHDNLIIYFNQT